MENKDLEKNTANPAEEEQEAVIYGKAKIDGVAVPSKALEQATEDFPIVLMVGVDFIPIKAGEEVKTPYDAVVSMEDIQKIGPMIRIIKKVEAMTNVEAL